jgi:hypothetical protein
MGNRGNLVLIDNEKYEQYRCGYCTTYLPNIVFWGLETTLTFLSRFTPVESSQDWWYDDVWAEGGLILDRKRNVLFVFGGDEISTNIPIRRIYLQLMHEVWQGWKIYWAHQGVINMADYLSIDRERVIARRIPEDTIHELSRAYFDFALYTLISLLSEDGELKIYPLGMGNSYGYLTCTTLLDLLGKQPSLVHFEFFPVEDIEFPHCGFHIDQREKRIIFWSGLPDWLDIGELPDMWAGWDIQFVDDQFETHEQAAQGRIKLSPYTPDVLLVNLESILVVDPSKDPYQKYDIPFQEKKKIFDAAVAAWKKRNNIP